MIAGTLAVALAGCDGASTTKVPPLSPEPAVSPPAYGAVGSGPVVVVLALDMQDTLYNSTTTAGITQGLVAAGYKVVSLDLPCQGADADPSQPDPLSCWAARIASGDRDLFLRFC